MKYAFKSTYKNWSSVGFITLNHAVIELLTDTLMCVLYALKLWHLLVSGDSPLMELKPIQKLQHIHIHNSTDIQYYMMSKTVEINNM